MLRYEHLIGDKPPKSLDFEEWEEAVQRCWCAGLHMLTGENGLGFEKFVACYEEIIDTFIAEERLIIGLRALEAIFPIEGDKGIRETLMRRIATVRASFSEQGGMNENYEEDYSILREMIGDFVSLANKIKHNINLSEKDFEYMTEKFHFGISDLINDLFFIIVELGKLPSPDEIDQGVENGVSMDFPSKLPFSEHQFYNSTFRWDMAFDSEKIRQFNSIGGLSVSTYQEFLDEHHPVIAWEDIPEASPWESSEIDRGTVSRHGTFSQEPKKDSGPSERTSVELPESSENEEEPLVIFPIVLLGVPIVIDEDGDEEPWIEVFPGLRITWSDKVYEDHEIRRRCSDQHGFHEFKLLEIMSRETCGGYVCELEVDTEVAKELLEETGRGHLKEAVNKFSLYAIFRLFIVVFPGFSGVRLTNTYNRDWESLLDEWWDDHDVKIIPQTGIWTKLLNQYQKWPHKPFERVPSIDIGSLSGFWRAAIICLEDYLKDGRIFKSLDEPASAFLHSGTLEEKNSNFIIILSTLLGKHRSKDLTTAQIVSFIGSRWLWELENDDEAKSYFSDVVSNSINLRNDTAHGRFPSPKFLQETTDLQHDVLMRIYATIIHHGGIPSKDLVHSGLKGEDLVFNREWEDPIPLDIIRDDVSRWQ